MKHVISAGILIKWEDKVMLAHPTGHKWWKSYSIPKGHLEDGETTLEGALREFREETGIKVPLSIIKKKEYRLKPYKTGKKMKTVVFFIAEIKDLSELKLEKPKIPKKQLQLKEVDWCGFMTIEEAEKRIHPVMKDSLKYL